MNESRFPRLARAIAVTASVLVSACVVVPADGYYAGRPVMVAPPPPQGEVVGVAPGPGYVWIGGYWNWVGNRHVWTSGRWEAQRPGYGWVPNRWYRDGPGWRRAPGHWEQR